MKIIYKYPLNIIDEQVVIMPSEAKILTVQMQVGRPTLWAEVDTERIGQARNIAMIGTGNPLWPDDRKYIGTVQDGIGLVWHVYEYDP